MLFVGCSACGASGPYLCGGRFPHPPIPYEAGPFGPVCPWCGPMPAMFTCGRCGTMQGLYWPGLTPSAMPGMGMPARVAPAFQAPPGASPAQVHNGLKDAGNSFASEFGKQMGGMAAHAVGAWLSQ